jgi:inositol polyphosphate-4-phosphatase
MENLRIAVHKKVPKNVEVLQLAALATRLMNGVRFTSCKSAKDRTGMAVTLEQVAILAGEYHLADHESAKALAIMRRLVLLLEICRPSTSLQRYAYSIASIVAIDFL